MAARTRSSCPSAMNDSVQIGAALVGSATSVNLCADEIGLPEVRRQKMSSAPCEESRRLAACFGAPATPDAALAAALLNLRRARGQTPGGSGARGGPDSPAYARIERGSANPTWTTVRRIAAALDVSVSELGQPSSVTATKPTG